MRVLNLLPSPGPIPVGKSREEFLNEYLETNYLILKRFRQILEGRVTFATLDEEESFGNVDTGVVDLVQDQGAHYEVNNPLDREPIGIIPLIAPGIVRPRWNMYTATLNVTNGSTALTTTATFTASQAGGYLVAQSSKVKILSYTNPTTMVLHEPWPGATDAGINGSIMHKWEPDTVWLYLGGTAGFPGLYRLLFF